MGIQSASALPKLRQPPTLHRYGQPQAESCATCAMAILVNRSGPPRRACKLRNTPLPAKERERLFVFGCESWEPDERPAVLSLREQVTGVDADGWRDSDFVFE